MTDDELNQAAQRARASLERLLESLPFDDPSYMNVPDVEYHRQAWQRWNARRGSASAGLSREEVADERPQTESIGRSEVWGSAPC